MRPYPKLMQLKESPETVAFFGDPEFGIVVNSDIEGWPLGCRLHHDLAFEDVADDVVIWLTEGPKEPIYEAIETIDKIARLPPITPQRPDQTLDNQKSD
jgi:hypothetical protein